MLTSAMDLFSGQVFSITPDDIRRINMLNSEAEYMKLKKKLGKALSKIASFEKRILELTESKTRVDTRNNAARSLLQIYLQNSSLNAETRERFDSLLSALESPSDITVNDINLSKVKDVTLSPQSAIPALEVQAAFKDTAKNQPLANRDVSSMAEIVGNTDRKKRSSMEGDLGDCSLTKQPRTSECKKRKNSTPTMMCSVKIEKLKYAAHINGLAVSGLKVEVSNTKQLATRKQNGNVLPNRLSEWPKLQEIETSTQSPTSFADNAQNYFYTSKDIVSTKMTFNRGDDEIGSEFLSKADTHRTHKISNEEIFQKPTTSVQSQPPRFQEKNRNYPQLDMDDKGIVTLVSDQSVIQFFTKSLSQTSNSGRVGIAIQNLCKRLKYDPLALKLAVAYINNSLPANPDLEDIINNYLIQIVNERRVSSNSVGGEIAMVILKLVYMTCDKIGEDSNSRVMTIKILYFLSFFSEKISRQFFEKLYKSMYECRQEKAKISLDDIFLLLKKFSLVDFTSENIFSVNSRLQQYIRTHLREMRSFNQSILCILNATQNLLEKDEIPSDQMIHAQTIWKYAQIDKMLILKYQDVSGLICNKLVDFGKYKDVSCEALTLLESAGMKHEKSKLKLKFWKGRELENLGRYPESLQLLTEVYEEQKESLGEIHDDTLKTANNISFVHLRLDNFLEALGWGLRTIEKREEVSGMEHPETLGLKNNIALVLISQKKYKEAAEIYLEVLQVHERKRGPNDNITLTAKHNLSVVRFHERKFEEALKMFQEVLEVRKIVLEGDHPEILATKFCIAETYKSVGKIKEAFVLASEVWQERKEILGPQRNIRSPFSRDI